MNGYPLINSSILYWFHKEFFISYIDRPILPVSPTGPLSGMSGLKYRLSRLHPMNSYKNSNEKLTVFRQSRFSFENLKHRFLKRNRVKNHDGWGLGIPAILSPSSRSPWQRLIWLVTSIGELKCRTCSQFKQPIISYTFNLFNLPSS